VPRSEDGSAAEDYFLLSRIRNSYTGGLLLVAAGLKQFGTEAAGRLLVDADSLGSILRKLPEGWENKNLQLVLHARVIGNTLAQPELVASQVWRAFPQPDRHFYGDSQGPATGFPERGLPAHRRHRSRAER
jgi:hypothetical protein